MKKLTSLILAVCMLTALFAPLAVVNVSAATSGETGDCTWTLDGTVLTISGNGTMGDYHFGGEEISKVVIEDGVTSIGERAFYNCTSLTSVTIPDSVTSIGRSAFGGCTSLSSVNIPNGVTSIEERVFLDCTSLTSIEVAKENTAYASVDGVLFDKELSTLIQYPAGKVSEFYTIPDSVTSVSSYAFWKCTSISSVTIPDSVTSIGSSAFCGSSLGTVSIGSGITSFEYCVFGSTLLTSITIPGSVTEIGMEAFAHCASLTSIEFGNGVTRIGDDAFSGCTSLTSVTIPEQITSIGQSAFRGCENLETIYFNATNCGMVGSVNGSAFPHGEIILGKNVTTLPGCFFCDPWGDLPDFSTYIVPDGITSIGMFAFWGSGLESITIPESVTEIHSRAFFNCSGVTIYGYAGSYAETYATENNIPFVAIEEEPEILTGTTGDCTWTLDGTKLTISGNGKMGDYAGPYAPWGDSITSVLIDDGVTRIGDYAFYWCEALTSVTIPDSVESIGAVAFYYTGWYNNQPDGLVYAGKVAYKYKGTMPEGTEIVLKDGTRGVGVSAFSNCTGLTSITIPNSVTNIGNGAFSDCTGLTSVTIPDSVKSVGNGAFSDCTGLTSVTIPDSVESIGERAFEDCDSLTSITIPNSVTNIAHRAFSNCDSLASVIIPNSVASIGDGAFGGCNSLVSVTIPDSVKSIGYGAFESCTGLTSIVIPDSVTNIEEWAFATCDSLASITIPESVTSIGDNAFCGSDNLTIYGYAGSYAETYANENDILFVAIEEEEEIFYGDATGDTETDLSDVIVICQHLADFDWDTGESSVEVASGADANGDGAVDLADVILLCQYLADFDWDTGESSVVLGPKA